MGLLVMLLAAWAFVVPLVGPYFDFGFQTADAWSFTRQHWILSLAPAIVVFAGGLIMAFPFRAPAWTGGLLAFAGGTWLVVGPSLYPVFSSGAVQAPAATEWKSAILWIGYFYGVGGLILYLSGLAQGLVSGRRPAIDQGLPVAEPAIDSDPTRVLEPVVVEDRPAIVEDERVTTETRPITRYP